MLNRICGVNCWNFPPIHPTNQYVQHTNKGQRQGRQNGQRSPVAVVQGGQGVVRVRQGLSGSSGSSGVVRGRRGRQGSPGSSGVVRGRRVVGRFWIEVVRDQLKLDSCCCHLCLNRCSQTQKALQPVSLSVFKGNLPMMFCVCVNGCNEQWDVMSVMHLRTFHESFARSAVGASTTDTSDILCSQKDIDRWGVRLCCFFFGRRFFIVTGILPVNFCIKWLLCACKSSVQASTTFVSGSWSTAVRRLFACKFP